MDKEIIRRVLTAIWEDRDLQLMAIALADKKLDKLRKDEEYIIIGTIRDWAAKKGYAIEPRFYTFDMMNIKGWVLIRGHCYHSLDWGWGTIYATEFEAVIAAADYILKLEKNHDTKQP